MSSIGAPELAAVTSNTARVVVRQIALLRPTTNGATKVVSRGRKVTFIDDGPAIAESTFRRPR